MRKIDQFPHCDARVLHAPGKCEYCDDRPEWQALREAWGINFSDETDPDKAPDPATARRSAETINQWPGNVAKPASCICIACLTAAGAREALHRMVLCALCGNKRCPHANDHRNACTRSNEPGQPGSAHE